MGKLEVPEKSRSSSSGLTRKQLCTSCDACWPTSWANPTWQSNERTPYRSAVVAMGRVLGWVARCASGQRRKQRRRLLSSAKCIFRRRLSGWVAVIEEPLHDTVCDQFAATGWFITEQPRAYPYNATL